MKRVYTWAVLTTALSLIGTPGRADDPPPLTERPNILLIVLDDVGVDKFSLYTTGATANTPHINQLAADGVYFKRAFAQPLCAPTRSTIMTGRYAFRTGMGQNNGSLTYSEVGLAKLLKYGFPTQTPYQCGAFGKWHLLQHTLNGNNLYRLAYGWEHPTDPSYGQDFDSFSGHMGNVDEEAGTGLHHYHWWNAWSESGNSGETEINGGSIPYPDATYSADKTRHAAIDWINDQDEPFFAYVCFNAPHGPLQVPPLSLVSAATQLQITNAGYQQGDSPHACVPPPIGQPCSEDLKVLDWMMESIDTEIQLLLDGMSSTTLDNTLIIIVGDNGTPGPLLTSPFLGTHGKGSVYEQGVQVPLIVKGPGVKTASTNNACNGLVHTVDIFPTIIALTGAVTPPVDIDGLSFWQMIADPTAASHRTQVFTQIFFPPNAYTPDPSNYPPTDKIYSQDRGMRDDRYKYIRKYTASPFSVTEEAYDLQNDKPEAINLWPNLSSQPPLVQFKINHLKSTMIQLSGK